MRESSEWLHSAEDIEDIDAAIKQVQTANQTVADLTSDTFVLPRLATKLESVREACSGRDLP